MWGAWGEPVSIKPVYITFKADNSLRWTNVFVLQLPTFGRFHFILHTLREMLNRENPFGSFGYIAMEIVSVH